MQKLRCHFLGYHQCKNNNYFESLILTFFFFLGGCGSMFAIKIVSDAFKGIPMIKQHRLVNQVLADEIKKWHGLQLVTKAPAN